MTIYDFQVKSITGSNVSLSDYQGKVLLIVNVASQCGFTSQYEGLEKLYDKYRDQGLTVLGFPCNQFGGQEPGSDAEIQSFCQTQYEIKFPLFTKIDVNGPNAHPLFQYLTKEKPGLLGTQSIKWNFTKFLIDKQGKPVKRFAPTDKPESIEEDVLKLLKA